jgi:hypothetical protein
MNKSVGRPEIGQWYAHRDKGAVFQVVGYDDRTRSIEIQEFEGDLDEIDADTWDTLPLERSEPPEDWTGPVDDVEKDDLGYSDNESKPLEWAQPLEARTVEVEDWGDTEAGA